MTRWHETVAALIEGRLAAPVGRPDRLVPAPCRTARLSGLIRRARQILAGDLVFLGDFQPLVVDCPDGAMSASRLGTTVDTRARRDDRHRRSATYMAVAGADGLLLLRCGPRRRLCRLPRGPVVGARRSSRST